ncbi:hypothetical protein Tco_1337650 [Tanacetum coccineum]
MGLSPASCERDRIFSRPAFSTSYGIRCSLVLPCGLTNDPAVFMDLRSVFSTSYLISSYCFIDDFLSLLPNASSWIHKGLMLSTKWTETTTGDGSEKFLGLWLLPVALLRVSRLALLLPSDEKGSAASGSEAYELIIQSHDLELSCGCFALRSGDTIYSGQGYVVGALSRKLWGEKLVCFHNPSDFERLDVESKKAKRDVRWCCGLKIGYVFLMIRHFARGYDGCQIDHLRGLVVCLQPLEIPVWKSVRRHGTPYLYLCLDSDRVYVRFWYGLRNLGELVLSSVTAFFLKRMVKSERTIQTFGRFVEGLSLCDGQFQVGDRVLSEVSPLLGGDSIIIQCMSHLNLLISIQHDMSYVRGTESFGSGMRES